MSNSTGLRDSSRDSRGAESAPITTGNSTIAPRRNRLINHLKEIHQLDNTLVFVMIGDKRASKEGTQNGVIERKPEGKKLTEAENLANTSAMQAA